MRVSFLLAGFITICCPFLLRAQETYSVTINKNTHRPVVKNNRVLWFVYNASNIVKPDPRITLYLYENGGSKSITEDASALFTGWPDLDDQGNIVFTRYIGSRHEVILYDGKKETRITNNPQIRNSTIDMGQGSAKITTGHARIHDGNIVFRDKNGHIYLYQKKNKAILKITSLPAHTANLGDYDINKTQAAFGIPLNAHVKQFDFDGSFITWMHEIKGYGMESSVTLIQADISEDFTPRVISRFDAWVPSSKSVTPKILDPFFSACNGKVIWQFYKPGPPPPAGMPDLLKNYSANLDDTRVWFFDGYSTKEIYQGSFVAPQSVKMEGDRAIWWHVRKEKDGKKTNKFDEIYLHQNGNNVKIASYPQPPSNAVLKNTEWSGILDVEVVGEDIYWVMGQVECFDHFKIPQINGTNELICVYQSTNQVGFFRRNFGQSFPFREMDTKMYAGGGEEDRGLYAFFSVRSTTTRDISATRLFGGTGTDTSNSQLSVIDRKEPHEKKWAIDEKERKQVIDAFSIEMSSLAGCGQDKLTGEAILDTIKLDISVKKQPFARFEDIRSLTLYHDLNKDGRIDPTDKQLAYKDSPVINRLTVPLRQDPITIKKEEPAYFIVELELKKDVCPCGIYTVAVDGQKQVFRNGVKAEGKSTGNFRMPVATIQSISGDVQSGLPGQQLKEKLAVVYKNFPVRCGKARFAITQQPPGGDALIMGGARSYAEEIVFDFTQVGDDAKAEAIMLLGTKPGLYNVTASVKMPDSITCNNEKHIFREKAGRMTVHILDMNDENYYEATPDNKPEYSTWTSIMTPDRNKLAQGGRGRVAAFADGASMLLIRVKLIGFEEPPPGDIKVSISGSGNTGHLSQGLGEVIPKYTGGTALATQWHKTSAGVYGFALYTPPLNFGEVTASSRNVHLKVSYKPPGSAETLEEETDFALFRPPVAFIHGFSSNSDTWGLEYLKQDPLWNKINIDYKWASGYNFAQLGNIVEDEIKEIIRGYRSQGVAATKVNMVAHSMGGLIVRQFFRDRNGLNYHRKDNFGQGDIYKFISLGVPHYGSPVAWLVNTVKSTPYGPGFIDALELLGIRAGEGGPDAMCPGSPEMEALGATYIPSHTIRCWIVNPAKQHIDKINAVRQVFEYIQLAYKDLTDLQFFRQLKLNLYITFIQTVAAFLLETGISALFSGDHTDMFVTLKSQGGGIAQGKTFEGALHMSFDKPLQKFSGGTVNLSNFFETTKKEIADYVFSILNKDVDDINIFAPNLPKPSIQDPAIRCN